ncbi:MAG: glutamine amidotransferase [Erysipelotrichaceae bacterium]|nr:glutamine amidotransferase [Erysipelotrichaceae bacterium]MDY6034074.1 glutamine amidotransferase [Bulleidia sp.]
MKLKILWMYHNLMDLYGDKGNIEVLRYRASKRGIEVVVDTCTIGEEKDITDYDLFFLGGGADREQTLIYKDLLQRKPQILQALDNGIACLLICGGYQLFGQYYLDQDGNRIDGLGIYDYYTESSDRDHRCIGNIVVETTIQNQTITVVGFENHGGQTKNVSTVFGKVLSGHGNTFHDGTEGFMNDQTIATYMHGPLLPKNPMIADEVIRRALKKNYGDLQLDPLNDELENQAHYTMVKRILKKNS